MIISVVVIISVVGTVIHYNKLCDWIQLFIMDVVSQM